MPGADPPPKDQRAFPIAQMLPDGMNGEVEKRREQLRRHALVGRLLEFNRQPLAFPVMIRPALLDQSFQGARSITIAHSTFSQGADEGRSAICKFSEVSQVLSGSIRHESS